MAVAHKSHPILKLKTSLPFNHETTKILKSYRFPLAFLFYDNTVTAAPQPLPPPKVIHSSNPKQAYGNTTYSQKLSLTTWGYPDRWCCPMVCGGGGRPVALPPGGGGGPPPIPGGLGTPGLGGGGIRWPGGGAMPCPWGGGATPCPWGGGATPCPWGGRKRGWGWGPGAAGPGKGMPPVWPWPSADGEAPAQCTTQHTGHGFVQCSGTMVVA